MTAAAITQNSAPRQDIAVVARQPIFDECLKVQAYELLYRTPGAEAALVTDPSNATARVVLDATVDIGMRHLVGDRRAFVKFPLQLLPSVPRFPLNPQRVVIEIPDNTEPDAAALAHIGALRGAGYLIALDEFDYRTGNPALLDLADIVKIDVREHSSDELAAAVRFVRSKPVDMIAEKIESHAELEHCRALGIEMFQGYFLERPRNMSAARPRSARLLLLELIATLDDPQVSAEEIEACLRRDVGFSYRILKCINSSYFQMPRQISSIREAVLLLGVGEVQRLCWLVLLAGLNGEPDYVCIQALTRARMCESLGSAAGKGGTSVYFMTGMLTLIDVILQVPFEDALRALSLRPAVLSALLWREGDLGAALACITAYERGDWNAVGFGGIGREQIAAAYLDAVGWAENIWKTFHRPV